MNLKVLYLQKKVLKNRIEKQKRAKRFWEKRLDVRESWIVKELRIRKYFKIDSEVGFYYYVGEGFVCTKWGIQTVPLYRKDYSDPKAKPVFIFKLNSMRIALGVPYKYQHEIEHFVEIENNLFVSVKRGELIEHLAKIHNYFDEWKRKQDDIIQKLKGGVYQC